MSSTPTFSSAALAALLRTIKRHGDFYASGVAEIGPPNLSVRGMGMLSLPFQQNQLAPLLAQAELAPFGRGTQTLIDTSVRHTWQIDAAALTFGGRNWQRSLDAIVARAADGLGVLEPVRAQLYKLLIYDTGSFFVEHRDTEKAGGMFATLVLVLPSLYQGGELLVRHGEHEVRLELAGTDPGDAAYAAFYADCVHQVLPVTSGARLALVYNLIRDGGKAPLSAPDHQPAVQAAASLLRGWTAALDSGLAPAKLVYPLEHAYSTAELGFANLKNVDAAVAQVLVAAAAQVDCEVHLALLDITENGIAEYNGYRSSYRGRYRDDEEDDDAYEMGELIDSSASLTTWRDSAGGSPLLGTLPLQDEELCPPGALDEAEADELHFHEATGNEGASFERAYRRAVLVLWPRGQRMAAIAQAPLTESLPGLEQMVGDWLLAGGQAHGAQWGDACALAALMVSGWPSLHAHQGRLAARMLTSLTYLQHPPLIDTYLEHVAAAGRFAGPEAASLAHAARLLPLPRAATLIAAIVRANVSFVPEGCAALLSHCYRADLNARQWLAPAVQCLADAVLGRYASPVDDDDWRLPVAINAAAALAVLRALHEVAELALGQEVAAHLLATGDMDRVLVEMAQAVAADAALAVYAPAQHVRRSVQAFLAQRIAAPLAAPADERRPSTLSCACEYCAQLARFLDDPLRASWTLRAAQTHRSHVETTITGDHCDVDYTTVRQGSPHGLVCTKNQASYEARCRQRRTDLRVLEQIG